MDNSELIKGLLERVRADESSTTYLIPLFTLIKEYGDCTETLSAIGVSADEIMPLRIRMWTCIAQRIIREEGVGVDFTDPSKCFSRFSEILDTSSILRILGFESERNFVKLCGYVVIMSGLVDFINLRFHQTVFAISKVKTGHDD
ncbi:MAG: hypothetical protein WCX74_00015 [Candidatus Paceibacterota bacterium]